VSADAARRHLVVIRFSTTDRTGVAVSTTDHGSIYRGIELRAPKVAPAPGPARGGTVDGAIRWQTPVEVPVQNGACLHGVRAHL